MLCPESTRRIGISRTLEICLFAQIQFFIGSQPETLRFSLFIKWKSKEMNLVKNLESLNEPLGKLRIYLRRFKPLEGHYVSF